MSDTRLPIELKILDNRLRQWGLPEYQTDMAAAVDIRACCEGPVAIEPSAPAVFVSSGIAIHIGRPDIAAVLLPRSGLGHKGLVLGNGSGLIDADFDGQVQLSLFNRNPPGTPPIVIQPGDRVAQMLFIPVLRASFQIVDHFSQSTGRDAGGYGSTGLR